MVATLLSGASIGCCAADDLYVATLHVVTTKGTYQKMTLKDTENGVSRTECALRREVWLKEFGPYLDSADVTLKKEGKSSSYKVICEPLVRAR